MSQSVTGVNSSWPRMSGPPASRASWQATAATLRAGAPPGDRELARDPAQLGGVGGDPLHGGEGVVGGRGEGRLGGVPVVDRHDDGVGPRAQVATQGIVGFPAAEHPAAAMEVGDDRVRTWGRRPVQPVVQRPAGPGSMPSTISPTSGPGRPLGRHRLHERPGVRDRHRFDRGQVRARPWPRGPCATSGCSLRTTPSWHCDAPGPARRKPR